MIALMLLMPVAANASASAEIMIEILLELNHFPTEDDQSFLDEILADETASDQEKVIASIIKRVEHKPADSDIATLRQLMQEGDSRAVQTLAGAVLSINHQPSDEYLQQLEDLFNELELQRE